MHSLSIREIPFVRLLVPFAAGIWCAMLFPGHQRLIAISGFVCGALLVCLIGILAGYRKWRIYQHQWIPGLIVHILMVLGGYFLTLQSSEKWDNTHFSRGKFDGLAVSICSEPGIPGVVLRLECQVVGGFLQGKSVTTTGKLLLMVLQDTTSTEMNYRYGDLLLIPANYQETPHALNPDEFDYSRILAHKAIYYQAFVAGDAVQVIGHDTGNPLLAYALQLRQTLVTKYEKYIHDRDAASLASTLILGYRAGLDRDIVNAYSNTGTTHVLSVSGMHVGIVFLVLILLLKFMDRNATLRLIRAVLIILLIWCYAVVTGLSSAACRAALMLSFVVISKAIYQDMNSYNLVAISAFILLICNPFFLADAGFQLSYLAVLGLVGVYPPVYGLVIFNNSWVDKLWSCTAVSIAAQLATFPVSMYYFHQFPMYFLLSNLFILVPVTLLMYGGLLFLFIPWHGVLVPFGWLLEKLISGMNQGLFYLENLPFATIGAIWISHLEYVLLYLLMIAGAIGLISRKKVPMVFSMIVALILAISSSYQRILHQEQREVIFYSLRKNLAVSFLQGMKGYVLTDLDGGDKTFNFSVRPSLSRRQVKEVQWLQPGKTYAHPQLYTNGTFLQFRNWKLMICDQDFSARKYAQMIGVQVVLLRHGPRISIRELCSVVNFQVVLIDGSNPEYRIRQWKKEAEAIGVRYYLLKQHPAYVVSL